jgi:methionine-rich copper-binding protein CopC
MKTFQRNTNLIAFFLLVGLALSSGCSHKVLVAPKPPEQITTEKSSLDVGLYISEEFKNHQVSENKMGDKWNYTNLGQASATQFQLALGKTFHTVEIVDSKPPFPNGKDITVHAVVEPAIDKFDFDIPFTKFQVYPARVHYKILVYDISGNIILEEKVEGIGDTKGHPSFDFTENPSASASKAVEDGVEKSIKVIVNSEKIQSLKDE